MRVAWTQLGFPREESEQTEIGQTGMALSPAGTRDETLSMVHWLEKQRPASLTHHTPALLNQLSRMGVEMAGEANLGALVQPWADVVIEDTEAFKAIEAEHWPNY